MQTSMEDIQTLQSLHFALDSKSLILSQFSDPKRPQLLQLTTQTIVTKRGPRYKEYSDLRDQRLRIKNLIDQRIPAKEIPEKHLRNRSIVTPQKNQSKFTSDITTTTPPKRITRSSSSIVMSRNFSSSLRKEYCKPAITMPRLPLSDKSFTHPVTRSGSKSMNSNDKRRSVGGLTARKGFSNIPESKGSSSDATKNMIVINGGKSGSNRVVRKCVVFG